VSKFSAEFWNSVYTILVKHVGARKSVDGGGRDSRTEFVNYFTTREQGEYQFMGSLGMGGKCYLQAGEVWVDCYGEDRTLRRTVAIDIANREIAELIAKAVAPSQSVDCA
jgi:hypothetical protein